VVAWWKRPQERLRALGLLALMAAMTALALGIGWGRSGFGPSAGLAWRYTTLGVLTLCCSYFVWLLYSPPAFGGLVEMCLFTGVVLLFALNMQIGRDYGHNLRQTMKAFESDVRAGEPLYRLTKRYAPDLFHHGMTVFMPLMKGAGIGVFRHLQEDPPFQEIPIPVAPATAHQVTWHEGTAQGNGSDSYLDFTLQEPRYVAGIRLTYIHSNEAGIWPVLNLFWKNSNRADFPTSPNFSDRYSGTGPRPKSVTIWIDDVIDKFRIYPDKISYKFKIEELSLIAPVTGLPANASH